MTQQTGAAMAMATSAQVPAVEVRSSVGSSSLPVLAPLADPLCSLAASWSGSLSLRQDGPNYGSVTGAETTLGLGGRAHGGVSVAVVASGGLRLVGVVSRPSIHLLKPTVLSGFVVPRADTAISWSETTERDRIVVSLDVSDTFASPKVVETVVACQELTPGKAEYDARKFVTAGEGRSLGLRGAAELMVSAGTAPVARTVRDTGIEVLAKSRKYARVLIERPNYVAFGWVLNDSISERWLALAPRVRMGSRRTHVVANNRGCAHALPLIAEVAGERAVVGELSPRTSFRSSTLDVEQGFVKIELFESWFELKPDAVLLTPAALLDGC